MLTAEYRFVDDLRRHRWLWVGFAIAAAVWCGVDVMPRAEINVRRLYEHRTDFTVYTEAGKAFFDGRDPYTVTNARGWHYLYPPLFAIFVAPLHALPSNWQAAAWFAVSAVMLAGCYVEMRRLLVVFAARHPVGADESRVLNWIVATAVLAALIPALNCLQRGQVEVFKLYLLLLGFRIFVSGKRSRDWCVAGIVFAIAIVLKLTPLLPAACLITYEALLAWRRASGVAGWKRPVALSAGVATGVLLFALFIPAALLGWTANIRHLQTWYRVAATKAVDVRSTGFGENVRSVRNQSLDNAAYRFGNWLIGKTSDGPDDTLIDDPVKPAQKLPMDSAAAGRWIVVSRVAALATLLWIIVRAAISGEAIGSAGLFGLSCVGTLVVCPVARGSYFLLLLPAVLFGSIWLWRLGRPRTALTIAIVPVALVWLYYVLLPFSGRIGLLGLGTAAWFFTVCALLERLLARQNARETPGAQPSAAQTTLPDSSFAAAA